MVWGTLAIFRESGSYDTRRRLSSGGRGPGAWAS
jgi:hypothetical protein